MVPARQIIALSDEIARKFDPLRIILFGSYANGRPTDDSDVDLLIVMKHRGRAHEQASRVRLAVEPDFAKDLIVRDPQVVAKRYASGDALVRDAVDHGIVLHDKRSPLVGRKGRARLRSRLDSSKVKKARAVRRRLLSLPAVR